MQNSVPVFPGVTALPRMLTQLFPQKLRHNFHYCASAWELADFMGQHKWAHADEHSCISSEFPILGWFKPDP